MSRQKLIYALFALEVFVIAGEIISHPHQDHLLAGGSALLIAIGLALMLWGERKRPHGASRDGDR